MRIFRSLKNFIKEDGGAAAIEYSIIAALITIIIIAAIGTIGTNLNHEFTPIEYTS